MADNKNAKSFSAKDVMLAEMVVSELDKFTETHLLIMKSNALIIDANQVIKDLLIDRKKFDELLKVNIDELQMSLGTLNKMTGQIKAVGKDLINLKETGVSLSNSSSKELLQVLKQENEQIGKQIKVLNYGVILALGMLFIGLVSILFSR